VIIATALMPYFIGRFGAAGAPLSLLATFSLTTLPLVLWEASYHVNRLQPPEPAFRDPLA
jgi:hypothetical protein